MSEHIYGAAKKEEVFVLYYNGKPIHVVKGGWNDWAPPKKIYYTLGAAKCGISNLPDQVDRSKVSIKRYIPEGK